jgi:hypothetical protein
MKRILFVLALVAAVAGNALAYEFHWPGNQYATNVAEFADGTLAVVSNGNFGTYLARVAPDLVWNRRVEGPATSLVPMPGGTMLLLTAQGLQFYSTDGNLLLERDYPMLGFEEGVVSADGYISVVGYVYPYREFLAQVDDRGNLRWIRRVAGQQIIEWLDILALPDGGVCVAAKNHSYEVVICRFTSEGDQLWRTVFNVEGFNTIYISDMALSGDTLGACGFFYIDEGETVFIAGFDLTTGEEAWSRVDLPSEEGKGSRLFKIASLDSEFLSVGMIVDPYGSESDAWIVRVSNGGELLESSVISPPGDRNYKLYDVTARSSGHYTAVGTAYTDDGYNVDCLIMQIPGPPQTPGTDLLARE